VLHQEIGAEPKLVAGLAFDPAGCRPASLLVEPSLPERRGASHAQSSDLLRLELIEAGQHLVRHGQLPCRLGLEDDQAVSEGNDLLGSLRELANYRIDLRPDLGRDIPR
jgi:hypothetical protein